MNARWFDKAREIWAKRVGLEHAKNIRHLGRERAFPVPGARRFYGSDAAVKAVRDRNSQRVTGEPKGPR